MKEGKSPKKSYSWKKEIVGSINGAKDDKEKISFAIEYLEKEIEALKKNDKEMVDLKDLKEVIGSISEFEYDISLKDVDEDLKDSIMKKLYNISLEHSVGLNDNDLGLMNELKNLFIMIKDGKCCVDFDEMFLDFVCGFSDIVEEENFDFDEDRREHLTFDFEDDFERYDDEKYPEWLGGDETEDEFWEHTD